MKQFNKPLHGYHNLERRYAIWNPSYEDDLFLTSKFYIETHLQYLEGEVEVIWYEDIEKGAKGPIASLKGRFYVDRPLGSPEEEMVHLWNAYGEFRLQNSKEKKKNAEPVLALPSAPQEKSE